MSRTSVILALLLGLLCQQTWAEPLALEALARLPGGGAGVMISSDGLIAVPTRLASSSPIFIKQDKVQAKVAHKKPNAPFALMKVAGGPYPTLSLGDSSLLHPGDEVTLWTSRGVRTVKLSRQEVQTESNLAYLTLEFPYEDSLAGWPVLNSKGEVVGLAHGPDPQRPEATRAISTQELKLFLFNEKLPPLKAYRGPTQESKASSPSVLEWEFPIQSGAAQRVSDLVELNNWRLALGGQGAQIAPLAVDSAGRLYLVSYTGSVYCLDVEDKTMLWRSELGAGGIVTTPPLLVDDRLLVSQGLLGGVSVGYARTGILMRDLFRDIGGRSRNAVTANIGSAFALSATSSEELWSVPTRYPAPPVVQGDSLLISGLGLIGAVDLKAGRYRWLLDSRLRGDRALWYALTAGHGPVAYGIRVPVVLHGGVASHEGLHLRTDDDFEVVALDIRDGRELWAQELPGTEGDRQPLGPKLSVSQGKITAVLPQKVVTLEAASGRILGGFTRSERALSDRITIVGDTMYAGDESGWYALSLEDGRRLWHHPAPAAGAAPLLHQGVFYGMSHYKLSAMDASSGKPLWAHTFSHRQSGQPVIGNGYLYSASMEGWITRVSLPSR